MAENKGADEILMKVSLDTSEAVEATKQLGDSIAETGKKDIGTGSVNTYKRAIKEAQNELEKLAQTKGIDSKEFKEAAINVQNLKNDFEELQIASDALNADNKLRGLATVAKGATGALQGVAGAFAFMGVESESAAAITARLVGLMNFSQALDSVGDMKDGYTSLIRVLGLSRTAKQADTVATEGATIATKGFGLALKSIGIGLIVAALAYLVTNFDSIKKSVINLFPSLNKLTDIFNTVKQVAMGVAGAIASVFTDKSIAEGYNEAVNKEILAQSEAAKKELLEKEIKHSEERLEVLKAAGKKTEDLERSIYNNKLQLYKDDKEKYAEALQEKRVFEAGITKAAADEAKKKADEAAKEAKTKRDAELTSIKENIKAAQKIVSDSHKSQLQKQVDDIKSKYKIEIDLAKKHGKSTTDLVKAQEIEIAAIKKQYADEIQAYLQSVDDSYLSEFDRKRKEIIKQRDDLLKNATPEQRAKIIQASSFQTNAVNAIEAATDAESNSNTNLTNAENANRPHPNDSSEEAVRKINNIEQAKLDAANAAYQAKKLQLEGQYNELQQLEASHNKNVTDIQAENAQARAEIAQREKENKLSLYDELANGAVTLSGILGESTIAGKSLAVAGALISTYAAIAGQLQAFSKVPVPGYAIAQAIATGLVGFANVKKILSVQVPAKGGSAGAGSVPSMAAPIINSTVLKQRDSGINDLRNDVNSKNNEPLKAYIVSKDLDKQQEKSEYFNRISSI